jgi:hypothetical protein
VAHPTIPQLQDTMQHDRPSLQAEGDTPSKG